MATVMSLCACWAANSATRQRVGTFINPARLPRISFLLAGVGASRPGQFCSSLSTLWQLFRRVGVADDPKRCVLDHPRMNEPNCSSTSFVSCSAGKRDAMYDQKRVVGVFRLVELNFISSQKQSASTRGRSLHLDKQFFPIPVTAVEVVGVAFTRVLDVFATKASKMFASHCHRVFLDRQSLGSANPRSLTSLSSSCAGIGVVYGV